MNPVTGVMTYLVLWWLVFFAVLPFGVRGQWEQGEVAHGSEPGAPAHPMLWRKVLWTSAITAVIWLVLFLIFSLGLLDVSDLPGPDSYWE